MAEITFAHVSKVYGHDHVAVRDLNLEISEGEFVVLVGPSGCGKTTALRMVAGLEEITNGEIRIGNRVVNDLAPRERDVAMVFQNYALYPHKNVYENLVFGLRMRKVPKGEQRRRVAEIARIQQTLKVTTLYVTHDQVEAMTMGHRVAVMRGGVLQQVDEPERIYDAPTNLFVASFVGSPAMNLLEADVERSGDAIACRLGDTAVPAPPSLAAYVGRRVAVGIRPEHVHPAFGHSDGVRLGGLVLLVEPLGSEVLVHVEVPVAPLGRVDLIDASAQPGAGLAVDGGGSATMLGRFDRDLAVRAREPIQLAIEPRRLLYFDLDTGAALPAVDVPVAAGVVG